MNIMFRKGTNERDDDQLILQINSTKKEETNDDDDTLILTTTTTTTTTNPKSNPMNDLLTQTVHQLFGKSSSTNSSTKTDSTHADEQLIDLN